MIFKTHPPIMPFFRRIISKKSKNWKITFLRFEQTFWLFGVRKWFIPKKTWFYLNFTIFWFLVDIDRFWPPFDLGTYMARLK